MSHEYFSLMQNIVREAGLIAQDLIDQSEPELKSDNSVVTKADLEISSLVHQKLQRLLNTPDHILIDEEDRDNAQYLNDEVLDKTPFIWAVDPIDGTRVYANQMPHYAISLGLIKNRKPWMGAALFPTLDEMFICDGREAFFVEHPFKDNEKRTPIKIVDQTIDARANFLCSDAFYKNYDWVGNDCYVISPACAVADLCWPAVGRACGALLRSNLWDFAGSWPIFQSAGLQLRSLETGAILDKIELNLFREDRPWKLKEYYVLSSERNFPILKRNLAKR